MILKSLSSLVALFVLVLPGSVLGFELLRVNDNPCARQDQNLSWRDASVGVDTSDLPSDFPDVANDARQRWNDPVRGFNFGTGFGIPCRVDGVTTMVFSSVDCGGRDFDPSVVAVTRNFWNQNGELMDADVTFNVDGAASRNRAVFLEVAMHELGHVLGLDHSDACGSSGAGTLMKAQLSGTRLSMPQADDLAGAEAIYPNSPGSGCCRVCTTGKACGDSCIEQDETCNVGSGCACNGGSEGLNENCAIQPPQQTSSSGLPYLVMPLLILGRALRRRRAHFGIGD